jgi:hypothetical protein
VTEEAQNLRKIWNKEKSLIELIKYEAKIFTDPDSKKKKAKKGAAKIYLRALDNIYAAMKGLRLIDRFGFNLPKGMAKEKAEYQLVEDFQEWEYHLPSGDWISEEHESTLTAYNPSAQLMQILEHNLDLQKE